MCEGAHLQSKHDCYFVIIVSVVEYFFVFYGPGNFFITLE